MKLRVWIGIASASSYSHPLISRLGYHQVKKFFSIFKPAKLGVYHPMGSVRIDANRNKKRGPDLSNYLVNLVVSIRKERKRDIVGFSEKGDFKGRITDADADEFNPVLGLAVFFDRLVEFIYGRSLLLTKRSVHAEYFNNDESCPNLGNLEGGFPSQAEIVHVLFVLGRRQQNPRQFTANLRGGGL